MCTTNGHFPANNSFHLLEREKKVILTVQKKQRWTPPQGKDRGPAPAAPHPQTAESEPTSDPPPKALRECASNLMVTVHGGPSLKPCSPPAKNIANSHTHQTPKPQTCDDWGYDRHSPQDPQPPNLAIVGWFKVIATTLFLQWLLSP